MPKLLATAGEIDALLGGLHGRHVPAGPSGSPTRGRLDVLPTGRNMYSVDPRALPSDLAYETGVQARRRAARADDELPETVGIVVWGTAAMRTAGDDAGEILALLGVRPRWHPETRRIDRPRGRSRWRSSGRPRIDVTVRISRLLPRRLPAPGRPARRGGDARRRASTSRWSMNFVRKHVLADVEELAGDWRARDRADLRRAPRHLRDRHPAARGRRATGATTPTSPRSTRPGAGTPTGAGSTACEARSAMRRQFARIDVAVKNVDTREHDLLDSSDYFAEHGGMIAYVRHLAGADPRAVIGDSSRPVRRPPRARWPRRRGACSARASRTRAGSPR